MKKLYYLSTCDTCRRIMKAVQPDASFVLQDIKTNPITEAQLEELYQATQSYEALVNKRARKLKDALALHPIQHDADYKKLLLMDYTFLKRPVFVVGNAVFAGNAAATIEQVKKALQ